MFQLLLLPFLLAGNMLLNQRRGRNRARRGGRRATTSKLRGLRATAGAPGTPGYRQALRQVRLARRGQGGIVAGRRLRQGGRYAFLPE